MRNCASCIWMDEDENGSCICTVEPPDYKGRYANTYPDYRCSFYESSNEGEYETKVDNGVKYGG